MGLPREVYESILRDVDLPVLCCLHLGLLAHRYPGVKPDTICGIFAQENQYKVLKSHHIHKANMDTYCSRYLAGEDLLLICADVDFPPCLMMRRMLEVLLGLSKQRVGDVLKQPALLQGVDAATALAMWRQGVTAQQQQQQQHHHHHHHQHHQAKPHHGSSQQQPPQPLSQQQQQRRQSNSSNSSSHQQQQLLHCGSLDSSSSSSSSRWDPQLLLQSLQRDVVRCVQADRSYSPYCDMAKSLAGLEHEALLYQQLEAAGVPFWSEQQLRDRGLFKTPDALLQVPICMRGADGSSWHMVHWLDSKASFGDDRTHAQQMEGQYATYVNRYGPGCVIYWFGFIADLAVTVRHSAAAVSAAAAEGGRAGEEAGLMIQQQQQQVVVVDVLLRDTFPTADEVMQLPQLMAGMQGRAALSA